MELVIKARMTDYDPDGSFDFENSYPHSNNYTCYKLSETSMSCNFLNSLIYEIKFSHHHGTLELMKLHLGDGLLDFEN